MLISPGSTCFVSSSNIDKGGWGKKRDFWYSWSEFSPKAEFSQRFCPRLQVTCCLPLILASWLASFLCINRPGHELPLAATHLVMCTRRREKCANKDENRSNVQDKTDFMRCVYPSLKLRLIKVILQYNLKVTKMEPASRGQTNYGM